VSNKIGYGADSDIQYKVLSKRAERSDGSPSSPTQAEEQQVTIRTDDGVSLNIKLPGGKEKSDEIKGDAHTEISVSGEIPKNLGVNVTRNENGIPTTIVTFGNLIMTLTRNAGINGNAMGINTPLSSVIGNCVNQLIFPTNSAPGSQINVGKLVMNCTNKTILSAEKGSPEIKEPEVSGSPAVTEAQRDAGKLPEYIFLLDQSMSMKSDKSIWENAKAAIDSSTKKIFADGGRFGVIGYSNRPDIYKSLNDEYSAMFRNRMLDRIERSDSQGTDVKSALMTTLDLINTQGSHGAKKVVFVITDEADQNKDAMKQIINKAREEGIEIVGLGVGKNVDMKEMSSVYGNCAVFPEPSGLSSSIMTALNGDLKVKNDAGNQDQIKPLCISGVGKSTKSYGDPPNTLLNNGSIIEVENTEWDSGSLHKLVNKVDDQAVAEGSRWDTSFEGKITCSPVEGCKNNIFTATDKGLLYNIDKETGRVLWKILPGEKDERIFVTPDNKGNAYVASGYDMIKIDGDGRYIWKYKNEFQFDSAPVIGKDGRVYATTSDSVYELNEDEKDGTVKGKMLKQNIDFSFPAVHPDGTLLVTSRGGNIYAFQDGKRKWEWREQNGHCFSKPVFDSNGNIYMTTDYGKINVFDVKSGNKRLQLRAAGYITSSTVVTPDNKVFTGDDKGNLWYGNFCKGDRELKSYQTGMNKGIISIDLTQDGKLFVQGVKGEMMVIDASSF